MANKLLLKLSDDANLEHGYLMIINHLSFKIKVCVCVEVHGYQLACTE